MASWTSAFNDNITGNSAGDTFWVGAGNDTITGGGGPDTINFTGSQLGSDVLNETSTGNTLDFRSFGGPIDLDVGKTGTQILNQTSTSNLSLTLSNPTAFSTVIGTPFADSIVGNNAPNEVITGGGGSDSLVAGSGNDYVQGYVTQVVYLAFPAPTETAPDDHVYTPTEEQQILDGIEQIYGGYEVTAPDGSEAAGYEFTLDQATAQQLAQAMGGQYATLTFDGQVANGGGEASQLDTGNLELGGSALIDVTPFLGDPAGGLVTPTSENVIGLSAEIAAHELGHLSGLQHQDALSPIGSGIYSGVNPEEFYPALPGVTTTTETSALSADGKSITLTATVTSDVAGAGTPTGTIEFLDTVTGQEQTIPLSGGVASTTIAATAASDTIIAEYSGDSTFASSGASQTPTAQGTTTVLTSNSTEYGENAFFVATVEPAVTGAGAPTGTVVFVDATTGATLGSVPLVAGVADSMPIPAASLTGHSIVALYSGDPGFAASAASQTLSHGNSATGAETPFDVMASPDSVGNSLAEAAAEFGPTFLGEHDLVTMAFNDTGTVLQQANLATTTPSSAVAAAFDIDSAYAIGNLPSLAVPNTLPSGVPGAGDTFDVTAVAVNGNLTAANAPLGDFYAVNGTAGQLMTFQLISNNNSNNPDPLAIPELVLVSSDGTILASNVHEFESADSTIFDATLPTTGTYYIGVDSANSLATGDYQLLMYSFATTPGPSSATGDTLVGSEWKRRTGGQFGQRSIHVLARIPGPRDDSRGKWSRHRQFAVSPW